MPEWYADPDPRFQPAMRIITNITQAYPTVITTSPDHDYVNGMIVRIRVPQMYGMRQIDNYVGELTVLTDDTFSLKVDARTYDAFSVPASPPYRNFTALVTPVGNISSTYNIGTRNVS